MDRLLVADRAGGRIGRGRHAHHSGARRRVLGAERRQDLHHQRARRRRVRGDGGDGSRGVVARNFGVHSRKRHAGIRVGKKENKLGMRCSPTGEVMFTDCRLPASQLCGKRGEGFVDSLRILDGGRISIAALSVGIAQGAYEAALKYSKQRKQFSRFISEFQAIQHKLADMATEIDAARLLTLRAAWLKDSGAQREQGIGHGQAVRLGDRGARRPMKRVQIHGGYGFIKDYPVEKFLSRREALHHRRRHQRNPAAGDRAAAAEESAIADGLRERIRRAGDIRVRWLAPRRWIENRRPEAEALLRELFPQHRPRADSGRHRRARARARALCAIRSRATLRAEGKTVGVIAVDPTSPYTGGAILGDRIRMQQHHADPGVFIRSMATRGWLGGLARATTEMTMLLDAAGFDVVIVETVGVGQDEVEIARLADVTLVVLVPGMGDDVQAIKAGIMEIADVFVINKADLPGAEKLERELKSYP